jgi:hypothetical protein
MLFAEKNIGFPIWKTERLDIVRNYIHKAYPQWQEKITCTHKEDKKFAFVCLLSTENSMWYQYLEYKYPALCERYKKENSDLIQYAEILRHRIDLGYNMSSDVSDKELVEHVFAQWIEAKFAKKDISSEISIFDDEIITSVYTKLQALQKEINQIKEHHV